MNITLLRPVFLWVLFTVFVVVFLWRQRTLTAAREELFSLQAHSRPGNGSINSHDVSSAESGTKDGGTEVRPGLYEDFWNMLEDIAAGKSNVLRVKASGLTANERERMLGEIINSKWSVKQKLGAAAALLLSGGKYTTGDVFDVHLKVFETYPDFA